MVDDPHTPRQYTEREVQLIIKSAVELQHHGEGEPGGIASRGMSLADVEQVASEAGIDPALIRRAAAQLTSAVDHSYHNRFIGGPTQIVLERVVDVPSDPSQFDAFLEAICAVTHDVGACSTVGRQFGYKGRLEGLPVGVSVAAGERSTSIRVTVSLDDMSGKQFVAKFVGFGMAGGMIAGIIIGATIAPPLGIGIAASMLGSGYAWGRAGHGGAVTRYRVRANELIDAIASRLKPR